MEWRSRVQKGNPDSAARGAKARSSAMEILFEIRMVSKSMQAAKIINKGNEPRANDSMAKIPK